MFSENNRISGRQMYRLMTYDLLGIGTLLVPQMLAKAAGRDGILSIGIGMAAALMYLWILRRIAPPAQESYPEYMEAAAGKNRGRESYRQVILIYLGAACRVCGVSICRHYSPGSSARRIVLSGPFGYHAAGAVWTCEGNRGTGESL